MPLAFVGYNNFLRPALVFRTRFSVDCNVRLLQVEVCVCILAGRGLFAVDSFCKGDFVVEYRSDLIDYAKAERRRKVCHLLCAAFFFFFKWRGKAW